MSEEQSKVHPEIAEVDWIDDAFYIEKTRFGLYKSIKKNGDGFLTGLTYDAVLEMSRWHLKCEQGAHLNNILELLVMELLTENYDYPSYT